ncbi:MAG: heavy metal translocating P-type ATPase [Rhizobiaceae bacterium]|nr:heavy metal translocating P-type ATPase [Rhizobiaceae bacterium]
MTETLFRRLLAAIALAGLVGGVGIAWNWLPAPASVTPALVWTVATVPVIVALIISIVRDVLIGRFGVDAIALLSMTAALVLGQPLAAVVVSVMYSGGVLLEDFARGQAERSLRALEDRSPRHAHRHRDGSLETVPIAAVLVGDSLLVRAGELVPVDGTLLDREARLDESAITGEPLPVSRSATQFLRSGAVNAGEAFSMRATALAEQSTYAGILRLVAAAHTARAPFIRLADRYALLLLPVAVVVAAAAWFLSGDPLRGLAVLVVATPCPLILAAPVAFIGGISRAAREGVLMKGSPALEALAAVRTAVFDKTGTLTLGGAELLDAEIAPGREENETLRLVASLEQASRHVVAGAMVDMARRRSMVLTPPREVSEERGAGLSGMVGGIHVAAGSRVYVMRTDPVPSWAAAGERRFRDQPVLRVFVALEGRLAAVFTFGDALRPDALDTIEAMRRAGIARFVMLTGDDEQGAGRIAQSLPLDRIVAHATPGAKVDVLREEIASQATMMIGDGINDAPALAMATVGVAMGARGATASSEAADIVILPDRLAPVVRAIEIAHRTRRIALQSVVAGLALSGVAMVAAAFGWITPVQGAFIQEGIDLAVILNALRTLRR